MHKLHLACALLGSTLAVHAQNCSGNPPARTISTTDPFVVNFYSGQSAPVPVGYTGYSLLFDLAASANITITAMETWNYDQGVGNPVVPNQVGAQTTVNVWTCANTWSGNQTIPPGVGSPWTLAGSGTLTVAQQPTNSTITFATPVPILAGTYGVLLEVLQTTSGPNPGPLHHLILSPGTTLSASDQFVSLSNYSHQNSAFQSGAPAGDDINLQMTYTPAPNAAFFSQFGDGCYFAPHAFYESFPESPNAPDLANTGIQMINLGSNYLVAAVAPSIVPPVSASLTAGPFGASSSASWDDALSAPIALPFTFNYPGGSTSVISVSSNGHVYLDAVTTATFDICGAAYGSIAVFKDGPPRIAAYYHDLDPTVGGGIHVDVDPNNQFVRITWNQVQEWGVPAAVNTMQLTLFASGQVDIHYGSLGNQSATNNALVGFTPGNGARLPNAQDLSATMPFQSGDGRIPPVLGMDARPVLGTTPNIVTTNITPGTSFVFLVMGFGAIPAGVELSGLGMPGCRQYITPFTTVLAPVVSGQSSVPLNIPNNPIFLNVQVFAQSAPITPALNPAGILTSNGMCLKVSNQ